MARARGQRLAISLRHRLEVKIPLLGGKLEKSIGANFVENIPVVQRFTTTWIAEHA